MTELGGDPRAWLAAIVDSSEDAIIGKTLDGTILSWNRGAERLYGYRADETVGRSIALIIPPERPNELPGILARLRAGERIEHYEAVRVRKDRRRLHVSLSIAPVRGADGAIVGAASIGRDVTGAVQRRRRAEGLLRIARRFAADPDRASVLRGVAEEAVALLRADTGVVFRWDEDAAGLVAAETIGGAPDVGLVPRGHGVVGRAVDEGRAVLVDDYAAATNTLAPVLRAGARSVAAAPLLHEGRLLGALWVASLREEAGFAAEDAEVLEHLAALAAATLVGIEQTRLEGALLAARTAEHEVNNRLTLAMGYAELLQTDDGLPEYLREQAANVLRGVRAAAEVAGRLRRITELRETDWGPSGTTIDLNEPRHTHVVSSSPSRPAPPPSSADPGG